MMEPSESLDFYVSRYGQVVKGEPREEPGWIRQLREKSIASFKSLGFPSTRLEEWRYTNVSPIATTAFHAPKHNGAGVFSESVRKISYPSWEGYEIVLVNGCYSPSLSSIGELPEGVKVASLKKILAQAANLAEPYLGRYANVETNAFTALNTSLMEDGVFIWVPDGQSLEKPVHLFHLTKSDREATVTHPRNLIILGKNSQGTFVESYRSLEEGAYFTNSVTEIVLGENAVADHCKVQAESREAFHVATVQVFQDRNSTFTSHSVSSGAALGRQDLNVILDGEGADCTLNGLYLVKDQQHVDHHTKVDHLKPHGSSRELYKGILAGRSTGVFNGKIAVWKDAQKTDAKQNNQNLLLSEDAEINSKPQLEILADDVKCSHGTAIGQIDRDALFYMRTRGIEEGRARSLLTYGFAFDVLARIKVEAVRIWLERELLFELRSEEGIREAV